MLRLLHGRVLPRLPRLQWVVIALTHTLACSTATTTTNDGVTDAVEAASGAPNNGAASADFCNVQRVLQDKCQRCHSDPPQHGAPFALVTYDDTQALDRHEQPRYLAMEEAVASGTMPATFLKLDPPVEPLDESEKQLLLDWCAADAPNGDCP